MAQHSVWHVKFHLETSAGARTSGPYSAFIGISGGSRGDVQNSSTAAAVQAAVTNNLLSILTAQGFAGNTGPAGTVVVTSFTHASVPDCWS
jgi:hypothetical protein